MKPDDLEQQLERQPLRPVPAQWRRDILAAAREAYSRQASASADPAHGWPAVISALKSQVAAVLWPHPRAWAGLAAVWIGLLTFNLATRDPGVAVARRAAPASPGALMAWREQERLLVELIGCPERLVAERPAPVMPRPRSEGRNRLMMA